ncbi:RraA family protein [Pseudonocardia sulfidoxydans]|uniref:RraA family protein n=1 Tax=Pseudonocardia sulfidoxydans TaxID=54011 RepID=UPI00360AD5F2
MSTAALSDALGRLTTHRTHILDLVSPTPRRVLYGRAITIQFVPFRQDLYDAEVHNFARFFYEAIGAGARDSVLALGSSGQVDVSLGGGTKLSRLQNHRLAGLVTDGRLRDFDELGRYDSVFYCGGETVKAGTADVMPVAANVPVVIGGTTVLPGDIVYADAAAAVIVPSGLADEAFTLAADVEREDAAFVTSIRDEDPDTIGSSVSGREI